MAPYKPATASNPLATPIASARGSATIPAVKPPKKSPRKVLKEYWFVSNGAPPSFFYREETGKINIFSLIGSGHQAVKTEF